MTSFLQGMVLVALITALLSLTTRATTTTPPQEENQDGWKKNISKDSSEYVNPLPTENISRRIRYDEADEEFLCDSHSEIIYPESGMTKDSKSLLIVNGPEFKQRVRIEVCRQPGTPCNLVDDCLPNGYKSFCRQVYVYQRLSAVLPNGTIVKEDFKMPSACKCAIQRL